jgi:hypothetical protein
MQPWIVCPKSKVREIFMRCEWENCGKEFRPAKPWQRFCSPHCKDAFHNLEKKRDAVRAAEDAREDRINGIKPGQSKKIDLVALGLVKPKPLLALRPIGAQPKNAAPASSDASTTEGSRPDTAQSQLAESPAPQLKRRKLR